MYHKSSGPEELKGPVIESRSRRDVPSPSWMTVGTTQTPCTVVPGHSWGYSGRSVALTTHAVQR